ncbi:MAG TPA: hypothetical protein VGL06_05275 [Pseudonocardiaceae bacterium]
MDRNETNGSVAPATRAGDRRTAGRDAVSRPVVVTGTGAAAGVCGWVTASGVADGNAGRDTATDRTPTDDMPVGGLAVDGTRVDGTSAIGMSCTGRSNFNVGDGFGGPTATLGLLLASPFEVTTSVVGERSVADSVPIDGMPIGGTPATGRAVGGTPLDRTSVGGIRGGGR